MHSDWSIGRCTCDCNHTADRDGDDDSHVDCPCGVQEAVLAVTLTFLFHLKETLPRTHEQKQRISCPSTARRDGNKTLLQTSTERGFGDLVATLQGWKARSEIASAWK